MRKKQLRVVGIAILLLLILSFSMEKSFFSYVVQVFAQGGTTSHALVAPSLPSNNDSIATTKDKPGQVTVDLPAVNKPVVNKPPIKPKPTPTTGTNPKKPIAEVKDKRKLVALTFDDGPDGRYTSRILHILEHYDVKATFFLVGRQVKKYPEVVKKIQKQGHSIGNHSYNHHNMPKLNKDKFIEEITSTDQEIKNVIGITPKLFRAPYGAISDYNRLQLHNMNRDLVSWTVDTRDWAGTPSSEIMELLKKEIYPGGIILMHSFGGHKGDLSNTIEALPKVIEYLQKQGYTLVTVDELLAARVGLTG